VHTECFTADKRGEPKSPEGLLSFKVYLNYIFILYVTLDHKTSHK